jgi:ABC-type multidrug transport system fused ATPase/permease subunit
MIAHHLDTILNSDHILAINARVVAEFERLDVLLEDSESIIQII